MKISMLRRTQELANHKREVFLGKTILCLSKELFLGEGFSLPRQIKLFQNGDLRGLPRRKSTPKRTKMFA